MSETYSDLTYSDFPEKVSTMARMQDVTAEAKPLVDKYFEYYNANDLINAKKVIDDNPELLTMLVNAKVFNEFRDNIIATQRLFKDDTEDYIFTVVKNRGNWSNSNKYIKYNVVFYNNQPYMNISDDTPIATLPSDINYWYPLSIKGDKGESGTGLTPRGYWSDTVQYYKDDMVAYNNILWSAQSNNVNYIPTEASTTWIKLLAFSSEYLTYDNTQSGLTSNSMQGAIDELCTRIDQKANLNHTHTIDEIDSLSSTYINNNKIVNNIETTTSGSVLDASQGKVLADRDVILNMGCVQLNSEDSINNYLNNMSSSCSNYTRYHGSLSFSVNHSVMGGGSYYIEGFKTDNQYEWQRATSYGGDANVVYVRSKCNNTWNSWSRELNSRNVDLYPSILTGNDSFKMAVHNGNEINFGGNSTDTVVYFGYRQIDPKPIPTDYCFGSTGSAYIRGIPVAPPNTNYTYNICRNTVLTTYDYGDGNAVDIANGSIIAVYE